MINAESFITLAFKLDEKCVTADEGTEDFVQQPNRTSGRTGFFKVTGQLWKIWYICFDHNHSLTMTFVRPSSDF